MPQVSTSTSSSATLSEMRRGQVQNEALARREERRERVLARVDRLVRGMEAVAQRLSSDKVSTSQRSVLVSRFNELQRRVNEIDGVVGSEGRGDAVSGAAAPRLELKVDSSDKAVGAAKQLGQMRRRDISVERSNEETPSRVSPSSDNGIKSGNLLDIEA
jgi:hypothetical protein